MLPLAPLNHVLQQNRWALQKLAPFAGRQAAIHWQGLPLLTFLIAADGSLQAQAQAAVDATISLPADLPLRLLIDRDNWMGSARIDGPADLAEALAQVFRHLRWDAEADLARLLGDVAAHRLVHGAQLAGAWQADVAARLARNCSEYLGEERRQLVVSRELASFAADQQQLATDLIALQARVEKLEQPR